MGNVEYVNMLLKSTELIYIDTSTVMNVERFELFVYRVRDALIKIGKKIIVSETVCLELTRLIDVEEKQESVLSIFEILNDNAGIFDVRNNDLRKSDVLDAFADSKLLAELLGNMTTQSQLLITNDRNFGSDAYNLNSMDSCKGKKIKVCYLNCIGELHMCDCVNKNSKVKSVSEVEREVEQKVKQEIEQKLEQKTEHQQEEIQHKTQNESMPKKVGLSIVSFVVGLGVGINGYKYRNEITRMITKVGGIR